MLPTLRAVCGGVYGACLWSAGAVLPLWVGAAVLLCGRRSRPRKRQHGWRTPKACAHRACSGALGSLSTFPQRRREHSALYEKRQARYNEYLAGLSMPGVQESIVALSSVAKVGAAPHGIWCSLSLQGPYPTARRPHQRDPQYRTTLYGSTRYP